MVRVEFLTVGASKLKIMMTREEAEARGLNTESGDYDDPEVRRRFRKLLDEAKEKAGFDVGHEKVLIQLYPSRDGGMELFITKLGVISKEAANMISRSERVAVISTKRVYYIFDTLADLVHASKSIAKNRLEDSNVYLLEEGGYCLSFCEREERRILSEHTRLSEFGRRVNEAYAMRFIEHAKLLRSGDAHETFSRL